MYNFNKKLNKRCQVMLNHRSCRYKSNNTYIRSWWSNVIRVTLHITRVKSLEQRLASLEKQNMAILKTLKSLDSDINEHCQFCHSKCSPQGSDNSIQSYILYIGSIAMGCVITVSLISRKTYEARLVKYSVLRSPGIFLRKLCRFVFIQ